MKERNTRPPLKEENQAFLIEKPAPRKSLLALLSTLEPLEEDFPETADLPPRPVKL